MTTEVKQFDQAKAQEYFRAKLQFTTGPVELEHMLNDNDPIKVVDVRAAEDYAKGHIPGAINLPKDQWATPRGLSQDKLNVLYCYTQTCHLAARAAEQFLAKGYPVMEMEGGFAAWKSAGLEIEAQSSAPQFSHAM